MPSDCINFQNSGYFSKLIVDYLDENSKLNALYHRFPKIENFKEQIQEKSNNFPFETRAILVEALEKQYENVAISEKTASNIQLLKKENTFTITTGHQLNLFTGPLYFLYKIVSTINLCKELKTKFPEHNFVPMYWMATEDHDFEEINYFNFKDKKIRWNKKSTGPVGRISPPTPEGGVLEYLNNLGISENAKYLKNLFEKSYFENENLADATRVLANELFKNEGLVIIDGDDKELKKLFIPYAKKELLTQISHQKVTETIRTITDYPIQVKPREINLFYIEDNLRERILFENDIYKINNTDLHFSETEILSELEHHPEKFSPNVILRPLFQEVILPNLCYIGGGGEIAYWLELKSNFEANNITFPILLVRNSVLLVTQKQVSKLDKLALSYKDIFMPQSELITKKVKELSAFTIDFSEQKTALQNQFKALYEIANQTDKSFLGAVKAQEIKQVKGLENLEKRLLKAESKNLNDKILRILEIKKQLFPNQSLQERHVNFSEFYLEFGTTLIQKLLQDLKPLGQEFNIIEL